MLLYFNSCAFSPQNVAAAGGSGVTEQSDDREGSIEHPSRGTLPTYLFEEQRNVHYYFDKKIGSWVRLPIAWELHSELVKKLIQPIEVHELLLCLDGNFVLKYD